VTRHHARRDNGLRIAVPAMLAMLLAACGTGVQPAPDRPANEQPAATPSAAPSSAATSSAATSSEVTGSAAADPWVPDDGPGGVLAAIYTEQFADHDRVVFHFHGRQAPSVTLAYADEIRADPSDRPVPLLGTTFVRVVFHGGRLDTLPIENDPTKVVRYAGPTTLTPRYQILQQLSAAGDFEAVLSFGLGLSGPAEIRTSTPDDQGSVIIDLWR
jgi:hypothetical protein